MLILTRWILTFFNFCRVPTGSASGCVAGSGSASGSDLASPLESRSCRSSACEKQKKIFQLARYVFPQMKGDDVREKNDKLPGISAGGAIFRRKKMKNKFRVQFPVSGWSMARAKNMCQLAKHFTGAKQAWEFDTFLDTKKSLSGSLVSKTQSVVNKGRLVGN